MLTNLHCIRTRWTRLQHPGINMRHPAMFTSCIIPSRSKSIFTNQPACTNYSESRRSFPPVNFKKASSKVFDFVEAAMPSAVPVATRRPPLMM